MQHNNTQFFTGIAYSYIHCIDDYLALLNNSLFTSLPYLDEETKKVSEELQTIFLSLPTLLSENEEIKETYAHQLISFRPILETKFRVMKAYERELFHLAAYHNSKAIQNPDSDLSTQLGEHNIDAIDFKRLEEDCSHFVFEVPKMSTKQERGVALLPYIPIRMTKENFLYYVGKSIKQIAIENTKEDASLLVSLLWQFFDGTRTQGYGEHFKDIFDSLTELKESENEEEFNENAELLEETISNILEMLHKLYHIVCSLCTLLLVDTLDFSTLTDMHVSFSDLFYSIKQLLTSEEDKEIFLSTLPDRVSEIKKGLEKDYNKACKSKKITPIFALIHTYLMMDMNHLFGFSIQKGQTYSPEVEKIIDQFLIDLKEQLFNLPSTERKLRMQYFIAHIPFIMSQDTFKTYIDKAFSSLNNPKQNLLAALSLSNVLEEMGCFNTEEGIEEPIIMEEPMHDHDHDHCDCHHHEPDAHSLKATGPKRRHRQ